MDDGKVTPLVTIITVAYNSKNNLKKTLESIKEQSYEKIESVIVDGGSTDGSTELIKEFASSFISEHRTCKWVSEKDNGLYDAINKGIKMASGDIIGCLWDIYSSSYSLEELIKELIKDEADAVHSDLVYMDEKGKIIRLWKTGMGNIYFGWMPGHPTLYLKRWVYEKYGNYDTSLTSASDYDFIIRIFLDKKVKLAYVPKIEVKMFYGGLSTESKSAYLRSIFESVKALRKNNVNFVWIIVLLRCFKTAFQFLGSSKRRELT